MIDDLPLWSSVMLLVVGVCALAVWAARQPDSQSELIERLTGKQVGKTPAKETRDQRSGATVEPPPIRNKARDA